MEIIFPLLWYVKLRHNHKFLENDFLQHNLGLMEEEMWEARLAAFTDTLSSCFARKTFEEGKFRIDRRFVELVENRLSVDCEGNQ